MLVLTLFHLTAASQADVYSFGVMLWEIVTGEIPSRGGLSEISVPKECPAEINELIQVSFFLLKKM